MYEERTIWYAEFDEEHMEDFPVRPGSAREHEVVEFEGQGVTVTTYLVEDSHSAVEGEAYVGHASYIGGEKYVLSNTRHGAYCGMVDVMERVTYG